MRIQVVSGDFEKWMGNKGNEMGNKRTPPLIA